MWVSDSEYQGHVVFGEIDRYITFYKELSESVFHWVSQGTKAFVNIDTYVYSSMQGTLTSIRMILHDGRINDAYALLRKYYDSTIINIYSNLYLEDHYGINNFVVTQIDDWRKGRAQLPEYRIMSQYVRTSSKVKPITDLLFSDDTYSQLRDRCNDHTHYNFYQNVLLNDSDINISNRGSELDMFCRDVRKVFVLHIAYLFYAKENYMMASDHLDALECGMAPESDSQFWVAPFIQDAFDRVLAIHRPDVAAIIRGHTSMHLT